MTEKIIILLLQLFFIFSVAINSIFNFTKWSIIILFPNDFNFLSLTHLKVIKFTSQGNYKLKYTLKTFCCILHNKYLLFLSAMNDYRTIHKSQAVTLLLVKILSSRK